MPVTLDDLADHLKEFFASKLPVTGGEGPGSVFLVFDSLGRPLSAQEFTGPDGAASNIRSRQRAADLADQLPAANALKSGWFLPRGGGRLSAWYENMARASSPPQASDAERAAFAAAKDAALRALEHNKLPAPVGIATLYETSMSPPDWFTAEATGWNTYSVGTAPPAEPAAPATPAAPPSGGGGGSGGVLGPGNMPQLMSAPLVSEQPAGTNPAGQPKFTFQVPKDPQQADLVNYVAYAAQSEPASAAAERPAEVERLMPAELTEAGQPAPTLASIAARAPEVTAQPAGAEIDPQLGAALGCQAAAVAVDDETVPTAATTGQFAVSFEYCHVQLERPWWNEPFLHRTDWSLPGYATGKISSGSATQPEGEISLVTVGMLVIRNLTITATWSGADLETLPRSTSLGPFCIAAADFDKASGTLTRKGLQVIGWLCLVPPVLPPKG
ncbi:hypothetical protein [Micromonospora rubida]